jgi:tetratricopeptide (TPR) repeat protein
MARARLMLALRNSTAALAAAQAAIVSARAEGSSDPIAARYSIAAAYRLLGDAQRSMGDPAGATRAWSTALQQLPRSVPERPSELYERAQLLSRVGRSEEARQLLARLAAMGYRNTI